MHPLDNAVWHALTGPHATLAERAERAARYIPEVSVFGAVDDDASPEAWNELRNLVGAGGVAVVARPDLSIPEDWSEVFRRPCRQMVLTGALTPESHDQHAASEIVTLGAPDVPEMFALVEATKPGPFVARTIDLGTYIGIRERGVQGPSALIAMAGERMHPPGFVEISAVCTAPSHRGRGLASQLVRILVNAIQARGEMPYLNLMMTNEAALRVYAALGFETRGYFDVTGLRAPD